MDPYRVSLGESANWRIQEALVPQPLPLLGYYRRYPVEPEVGVEYCVYRKKSFLWWAWWIEVYQVSERASARAYIELHDTVWRIVVAGSRTPAGFVTEYQVHKWVSCLWWSRWRQIRAYSTLREAQQYVDRRNVLWETRNVASGV